MAGDPIPRHLTNPLRNVGRRFARWQRRVECHPHRLERWASHLGWPGTLGSPLQPGDCESMPADPRGCCVGTRKGFSAGHSTRTAYVGRESTEAVVGRRGRETGHELPTCCGFAPRPGASRSGVALLPRRGGDSNPGRRDGRPCADSAPRGEATDARASDRLSSESMSRWLVRARARASTSTRPKRDGNGTLKGNEAHGRNGHRPSATAGEATNSESEQGLEAGCSTPTGSTNRGTAEHSSECVPSP